MKCPPIFQLVLNQWAALIEFEKTSFTAYCHIFFVECVPIMPLYFTNDDLRWGQMYFGNVINETNAATNQLTCSMKQSFNPDRPICLPLVQKLLMEYVYGIVATSIEVIEPQRSNSTNREKRHDVDVVKVEMILNKYVKNNFYSCPRILIPIFLLGKQRK